MIRIGFFGTPSLAADVLRDILDSSSFEVSFVVTNPDKPFGRSSELKSSAVKNEAIQHGIHVFQPEKVRGNTEFLESIRSFACDYFVVVAYGKILPKDLLEIPKKMCINVHGSILPKYRGASPIQSALLQGEKETGVTIMKMSEGMDEGDILKIRTISIEPKETSETLFSKFSEASGPALIDTLSELEHGGITSLPQDHTQATYCKKIQKEEGLIDWSNRAERLYHKWQAYTPWPGIYTMYEGKRLVLERVSVIPGLSQNPEIHIESSSAGFLHAQEGEKQGQVIRLEDGRIGVNCSHGILILEQVKLEGKKSQSILDFVNGQKGFIGYKIAHETGNTPPSNQ